MKFNEHHQCLLSLGLRKDYFVAMDGEWKDYFTPDARKDGPLASGQFGEVVIVKRKSDGKRLALKLFKEPLTKDEYERIGIALHLSNLKKNAWPKTLVRYLGAITFSQGDRKQALVMEPIDGTTFQQFADDHRTIDQTQSFCYLADILEALLFLHSNGISHRDVHAGNIMVTSDGNRAILLDLDLFCRPLSENRPDDGCLRLCHGPVTIQSTPPDIWCSLDYKTVGIAPERWFRGDVWGAASAYILLATGRSMASRLPYSKTRNSADCVFAKDQKMMTAFATAFEKMKKDFRYARLELLEPMLRLDWTTRLNAAQALDLLRKSNALVRCNNRSDFNLPLSQEEYFDKVASGEIVIEEGEYADAGI